MLTIALAAVLLGMVALAISFVMLLQIHRVLHSGASAVALATGIAGFAVGAAYAYPLSAVGSKTVVLVGGIISIAHTVALFLAVRQLISRLREAALPA